MQWLELFALQCCNSQVTNCSTYVFPPSEQNLPAIECMSSLLQETTCQLQHPRLSSPLSSHVFWMKCCIRLCAYQRYNTRIIVIIMIIDTPGQHNISANLPSQIRSDGTYIERYWRTSQTSVPYRYISRPITYQLTYPVRYICQGHSQISNGHCQVDNFDHRYTCTT